MTIINGYCSRAELKEALKRIETTHDDFLDNCINRASRKIEEITGGIFYSLTITSELFDQYGESDNGIHVHSFDKSKLIFPAPIISVTSIYEDNLLLTAETDYMVYKRQGYIIRDGNWTTEYKHSVDGFGIKITAAFGYTSIPEDIKRICIEIAKILSGLDSRLVSVDGQEFQGQINTAYIPKVLIQDLRSWSRKYV